jgi:hypothetical protein
MGDIYQPGVGGEPGNAFRGYADQFGREEAEARRHEIERMPGERSQQEAMLGLDAERAHRMQIAQGGYAGPRSTYPSYGPTSSQPMRLNVGRPPPYVASAASTSEASSPVDSSKAKNSAINWAIVITVAFMLCLVVAKAAYKPGIGGPVSTIFGLVAVVMFVATVISWIVAIGNR